MTSAWVGPQDLVTLYFISTVSIMNDRSIHHVIRAEHRSSPNNVEHSHFTRRYLSLGQVEAVCVQTDSSKIKYDHRLSSLMLWLNSKSSAWISHEVTRDERHITVEQVSVE